MPLPKEVHQIPGMISPGEREMYYRLASENYQGLGEIVEVGALFGASTSSFAAGLRDNKKVHRKQSRIHVYDLFEVYQDLIDRFLIPQNISHYKPGDDFTDLYLDTVGPYRDLLNVTKGDAQNVVWSGKPIEILFIDFAHSPEFLQAMVRIFYPYLMPGLSLVVDQDAFYQIAWWINIKNELLHENLVPEAQCDTTLVCHYTCAIDDSFLVENWANISTAGALEKLDSYSKRYMSGHPKVSQLIEIQKAYLLIKTGAINQGVNILMTIMSNPLSNSVTYRVKETLKDFGLFIPDAPVKMI